MANKPSKSQATGAAKAREARLKAALKANLQRRKAQAKVRGAKTTGTGGDKVADG
jgi:hypothetical protein